MDDKKTQEPIDDMFKNWFSTYGFITAERILSLIGFHLKHDDLIKAINDETSIYHAFLDVPFKNILNGIILAQVKDYREYAQRLFVDFLLSGAGNAPAPEANEIQPGSTKDLLEQERLKLIEIAEQFDLDEFEHNKLIAESQKALIALGKDLKSQPQDAQQITEKMSSYDYRAVNLMQKARQYRSQFYDLIVHVRDLLDTLPDYRPNVEKLTEHRASLLFDTHIGE